MAEYAIELMRGDDHLWLGKTEKAFCVDPKQRNAFVTKKLSDAINTLTQLKQLSTAKMRKLLKVDKAYEDHVRVFVRRIDRETINTAVMQITYDFKENDNAQTG